MKNLQLLLAITLFMGMQQINASADDRNQFHTALARSIELRRASQVRTLVLCPISTAIPQAQFRVWREEFQNLPGNQNIFQEFPMLITVGTGHQEIIEIRTFTRQEIDEIVRKAREREAAQAPSGQ